MTATWMRKIAEVAPDKHAFFLKTAAEVRESPFRDEIVEELDGIMKKANQGMPGMPWGNMAKGVGAAVGSSIAISLAGDMYDSLKRGITKGRNYKAMMKANPDLGEHDAKQVQKVFSTLHRFNPEFSSDPNVAGAFVKKQVGLESFDPQMLTQLVGARKNLSDVRRLPNPLRMDQWGGDSGSKKKPGEPHP